VTIVERVRALLGNDAVEVTSGPDAIPRVAPASPDAVALLLGTAREEGWRVRIEGAGTWMPADAPADLALTTRRLDRIPAIEPQDLSATAEAGIGCDILRQQLADRGTWLALDPPGLAGRTLGSVVATATAGPLRQGFGGVRDHVLGVTFVTGDGRLVQSGGRVMKNVAGYDLTKLEAGGFGAFGVIVLVHLRLRALPRADLTFVLEGTREDLVGRVRRYEGEFRAKCQALVDEHPMVGDLRGAGYFWSLELVKDKETKETFTPAERDEVKGFLTLRARDLGVYLRIDDRGETCAQFAPPLVAGPEQFDEMIGALRQALDEAWERFVV